MNAQLSNLLNDWSFHPVSSLILLALAGLYLRGWLGMRRAGLPLASAGRLVSFGLGLLALAVAFLSPLVALRQELLLGRAGQQLLIGLLAPPLLWLACPVHVIARGLPFPLRWRGMRLLRAENPAGWLLRKATKPMAVWLLAFSVFLIWHEPQVANWLLARPILYGAGLWGLWMTYMLFWWHPLGTGPRLHPAMPAGVGFFYVILGGEVPNMATGVILAFRKTPAYAFYADQSVVPGLSVMQDQMISGGMIWFLGSVIYVTVAIALLSRVFRNFQAQPPPPISWDATERTIAPGLEHRVLKPRA